VAGAFAAANKLAERESSNEKPTVLEVGFNFISAFFTGMIVYVVTVIFGTLK
jgi:hypothetical protein